MTDENIDWKFKVGDRVYLKTSKWLGTVKSLSVNWNPEAYYVLFDGTDSPRWYGRNELELERMLKERVVFT